MKRYRIVIDFKSPSGLFPDVRALCGDTIFLALRDGEMALGALRLVRIVARAAIVKAET